MTGRQHAQALVTAFSQDVVEEVARECGVSAAVLRSGARLNNRGVVARRECAIRLHRAGMNARAIAEFLNVAGPHVVHQWMRLHRETAGA